MSMKINEIQENSLNSVFSSDNNNRAYNDFFEALFKIPDRHLQSKVLRIVGYNLKTYTNQSTQTDQESVLLGELPKHKNVSSKIIPIKRGQLDEPCSSSKYLSEKRQRRSRQVKYPQASKTSQNIGLNVTENKSNFKNNIENVASIRCYSPQHSLTPHQTTFSGNKTVDIIKDENSENFKDMIDLLDLFEIAREPMAEKLLFKEMIMELIISKMVLKGGLLPIHETIIMNNLKRLKRQTFIWKEAKETDLNKLLTQGGENCLQLSLKNQCFPSIVDHLIHMGLNTSILDNFNNNVLHLVILHENNIRSLEYLLKAIDLKLLLFYNDDGLTPLHLAIHYNRYLMLELILNYLDSCMNENKILQRPSKDYDTNFQSFYFNQCKQFIKNGEFNKGNGNINTFKKTLIETPEMCTGNTILITAIINDMEHLLPFLLLHKCSPVTENFGGFNALNYYQDPSKVHDSYRSIYDIMHIISKSIEN